MRISSLAAVTALASALCLFPSCTSTDASHAQRLGLDVDDIALLRERKGLRDEELAAMVPDYARHVVDKLRGPRPDRPDEAEEWRLTTLRDEFGRIPDNAVLDAKAQMAALAARDQGVAGGLDSTQWTELGPGNIGGRMRAIAIDPTNPARMLVGSVAGGVWRSTNAGASWDPCDDLMTNLAVTSLVMTPGDPQVVYAATGEGFSNGDAIRGAGIFKSVDGGLTWAQLPVTANANFHWVCRLAMSVDGATLLAGTRSGMWRSTDAGATFTRTYSGTGSARCLDVKFHPTNAARAVAQMSDTGISTVLYTNDGGANWSLATGIASTGTERTELAWHKGWTGAGDGCVYALKAINGTTLYRSVDGGASFTQVGTSSILGSQGWYDNTLWVDPSDRDANTADDVVLAGGIDLWRSTNGGSSFSRISVWSSWPNSAHADQHIIVEHPNFDGVTNRTVYFGNDGGIWRTDNVYSVSGTNGWISLNNGIGITQFYGASRSRADTVIGGTQDNGTLRWTAALGYDGWRQMYGGDGGFCASDQTNSNYHYGEYVRLTIHRSTNGGQSASNIHSGIADAGSAANFIAPFVLDPNDQARLLAGGASLWRTNNARASTVSWSAIKPSIGSNISAIAVVVGDANQIWVGHNNGNVYRTTNGTAATPTWTRVDTTSPALPNRLVTRITIDPANAQRVFVTFGGFATDNLWETTDAGATWRALPGLPSAPVRDVELAPHRGDWLYAATEVGLLVSENNGTTWTSAATPANVSIDETFWADGFLYLATHGRGIWRQSPYPTAAQRAVGASCRIDAAGSGPSLASTVPSLGSTWTLTLAGGPANGTAMLFLGATTTTPFPWTPTCLVQIDLVSLTPTIGVPLSAVGTATFQIPVPVAWSLAGAELAAQVFAVDPGVAAYLSNGVEVTFGR